MRKSSLPLIGRGALAFAWAMCGFATLAARGQEPFAPQPFAPPPVAVPGVGAAVPRAAQPEPADEPIVGRMEHHGWSLVGRQSRHYIFGGLAMADYSWRGERRIVTMQEETSLPKDDPSYLYYRELRTGNRWAYRRNPLPDRTYSIWYQPQGAAKWLRLERGVLVWPAGSQPTPVQPKSP